MELQVGDHIMTREGESASVVKHVTPDRVLIDAAVEKVAENGRTVAGIERREIGIDDLELWTDEHEAKFNAERGIVEEP
jgi:hypothetical protein